MPYCINCGFFYSDGCRFCGGCGCPVGAKSEIVSGFLETGALLNSRYRMDSVLGRGGFGITYLGFDILLFVPRVIKEYFPEGASREGGSTVVPPTSLAGPDHRIMMEKFLEEARTIAGLNHPGIIKVVDFFSANNTSYYVTEYLGGQSLRKIPDGRGEPFRLEEIGSWVEQIAAALEVIHSKSLLHQDLKPENIIITASGQAVLIDFGAARSYSAGVTKKYSVIYTPGYAPPEQQAGQSKRGPCTDIYALGATLYELLTKQVPADPMSRYMAPELFLRPKKLNPEIGRSIDEALSCALELDPVKRPQTVKDFMAVWSAGKGQAENTSNGNPAFRQAAAGRGPAQPTAGTQGTEDLSEGGYRIRYPVSGANSKKNSGFSGIIGIDFGTTKSCIAVMDGKRPIVIPNREGERTTPSVVSFLEDGSLLVGQAALSHAVNTPRRTICSIKRVIGSSYQIDIDGETYSPQSIAALILKKLKADAETYLSNQINKGVIAVPDYFSFSQRQAVRDAGKAAGLDVIRVISDTGAAALAFGVDKKEEDQTVMLYDLGGGTFSVSILQLGDGVFDVKAACGDTRLGGNDFDQIVVDYLVADFMKSTGIDLRNDRLAMQRLKDAAERAKIELSSVTTANINLPFINTKEGVSNHLDINLTRAKFEKLTAGLIEKTIGITHQVIRDAYLEPKEIGKVILVGGGSRMPAVQQAVGNFLGKEMHKGINLDESVAVGAAILGGVLSGNVEDVLLLGVTSFSLGIETQGGVFTRLIDRNTTIPTCKSQNFTTAFDNQTIVDFYIFAGEYSMAEKNIMLGYVRLDCIQPAPRGEVKIEIRFDIDVDHSLRVTARELSSGKQDTITLPGSKEFSCTVGSSKERSKFIPQVKD